jgi:hypothetical protein
MFSPNLVIIPYDKESLAGFKDLPDDILLLLIDLLQDDVSSLLSLCLTCKGLSDLTKSYIYSKIDLKITFLVDEASGDVAPEKKTVLLHRSLEATPALRVHIRTLSIGFSLNYRDTDSRISVLRYTLARKVESFHTTFHESPYWHAIIELILWCTNLRAFSIFNAVPGPLFANSERLIYQHTLPYMQRVENVILIGHFGRSPSTLSAVSNYRRRLHSRSKINSTQWQSTLSTPLPTLENVPKLPSLQDGELSAEDASSIWFNIPASCKILTVCKWKYSAKGSDPQNPRSYSLLQKTLAPITTLHKLTQSSPLRQKPFLFDMEIDYLPRMQKLELRGWVLNLKGCGLDTCRVLFDTKLHSLEWRDSTPDSNNVKATEHMMPVLQEGLLVDVDKVFYTDVEIVLLQVDDIRRFEVECVKCTVDFEVEVNDS